MKKIYLLITTTFTCFFLNSNAQTQIALNFDGIDDHINVGSWWNYQEFTVQMWINPAATQVQYAMIIDDNHILSTRFNCQQNANITNEYLFGVATTGSLAGFYFNLTANTWQHLTLVKDTLNIRGYLNGVLIDSVYCSGSIIGSGIGLDNIFIGQWNSGGRNWSGTMDEIRLWNRALTQAEVQADMFCGLAGNEPGLVCYYKLNQGTAGGNNTTITTAIDSTSNAHDGILVGFNLTGSGSNFVSAPDSLSDCTVGIYEIGNNSNGILVYPNPFTTDFIVHGTAASGELLLIDVLGKEIFHQKTFSSEAQISTENLLPGIYLLSYSVKNITANLKLVKF